uniref:Uncharacterized protein n=1 Tax=Rhizophora mucronata TaxID=61149 RepID=A0A2P2J7H6_RHIMU
MPHLVSISAATLPTPLIPRKYMEINNLRKWIFLCKENGRTAKENSIILIEQNFFFPHLRNLVACKLQILKLAPDKKTRYLHTCCYSTTFWDLTQSNTI